MPKEAKHTLKKKKSASAPKRAAQRRLSGAGATDSPVHPSQGDRSRPRTAASELTWMQFERQAETLAQAVRRGFRPEAVVGLARGGVFVGSALARAFGCAFFPVRLGMRSRDPGTRAPLPLRLEKVTSAMVGKRVLVTDDIASSGDLLELAKTLIVQAGAKQVRTATLIARPAGYVPDWSLLSTDELVVFPWDYEPLVEDGRFDGWHASGPKR